MKWTHLRNLLQILSKEAYFFWTPTLAGGLYEDHMSQIDFLGNFIAESTAFFFNNLNIVCTPFIEIKIFEIKFTPRKNFSSHAGGFEIDFERKPIFGSASWFFVIILKFFAKHIFEIKIHTKKFHFWSPNFKKIPFHQRRQCPTPPAWELKTI